MTLWQAFRQSTIVNKVGAVCGVLGVLFGLTGALVGVISAFYTRQQYHLAIENAHNQRLLDWQRMRNEDMAQMPNIQTVSVPVSAINSAGGIAIMFINKGNGTATNVTIDDIKSGVDLFVQVPTPIPAGQTATISVPTAKLDRSHLLRVTYITPHGSVNTESFYLPADNDRKVVSDTTDSPYDFLIKDEPGRRHYKPSVIMGFGNPNDLR